ncbi:MAG: hypothetical protein LBF83_09330 [Spirochaetaceae bacterium]|jgi:CTP synthase|nr:hypothetical protein [Spirochaetaceae bacterium]
MRDSTEFTHGTAHPVISLLEDQVDVRMMGGTMRLGDSKTSAREGTLIHKAYNSASIRERHRHRYKFSNKYRDYMLSSGLVLSAFTPDDALVESVEWPRHTWGLGVQFRPEFKSKPTAPHPLFTAFVRAASSTVYEWNFSYSTNFRIMVCCFKRKGYQWTSEKKLK